MQPPSQWLLGAVSPGVKWQWSAADLKTLSSAKAQNALSCTSTAPLPLHGIHGQQLQYTC